MKDNNWIAKENRAKIAKEHTKFMESFHSEQIAKSVQNTKIYEEDTTFCATSDDLALFNNIFVIASDSVSAAFNTKDSTSGTTAILNFASYKNPVRMLLERSKSQE